MRKNIGISLEKYHEEHPGILLGENNPNWKGKVIKVCPVCKEEFEVYFYQKDVERCR